MKDLVLEVQGAGGDNDFLAALDSRRQVCQCFADAGPGLNGKSAAVNKGLEDCLCHLQLTLAGLKLGHEAGQGSFMAEDVLHGLVDYMFRGREGHF